MYSRNAVGADTLSHKFLFVCGFFRPGTREGTAAILAGLPRFACFQGGGLENEA
jgi:hypothetical protein